MARSTETPHYELLRGFLGALTGTILEIGAGYGTNFADLPPAVRWIGLEPNRRMHRRLTRSAKAHGYDAAILAASAEHIPLPDSSVDAVVATLVLCTVGDPDRALSEVRRVLRGGGVFVFWEHVAAVDGTLAHRAQRVLAPLSRRFDGGCDPTRHSEDAIRRAGFAHVDVRRFSGRALAVYYPLIVGRAVT